jgi:hypothetical protein
MKSPKLRDVWWFTRPAGFRYLSQRYGASYERAEHWIVAIWQVPGDRQGGYDGFAVQAFFRGEVVDPANPYRPEAGKLRVAIGEPTHFKSLGAARERALQKIAVHSGKMTEEEALALCRHVDFSKRSKAKKG